MARTDDGKQGGTKPTQEGGSNVARVTELSCRSNKSFEEAVQIGIARATKTLQNVTGAWIKGHEVVISNAKVTEYRVRLKVTFVLND